MKNYKKIFIYFSLALFTLITFNVSALENTTGSSSKTTSSSKVISKIPTKPTVKEVPVTAESTANVSTPGELLTAYYNTSISKIVLQNDITLSSTQSKTMFDHVLTRSIMLDGGGHTLLHYRYPESLTLINARMGNTIHFKDIDVISPSLSNLVVHNTNSQQQSAIILENTNVYNTFYSEGLGQIAYASVPIPADTYSIVFRGNNKYKGVHLLYSTNTNAAHTIILDEGSNNDIVAEIGKYHQPNIWAYDGSNTQFKHYMLTNARIYSSENSNIKISDPTNKGYVYSTWSPSTSCSIIEGTVEVAGEIGDTRYDHSILQQSVKSACINVEQTGSLIAKSTTGKTIPVNFVAASSLITLDNPKKFDIENTNNGAVFAGSTATTSKKLRISNSDISFYSGTTGEKMGRSPYMSSDFISIGNNDFDKTITSELIVQDFTNLTGVDRIVSEQQLFDVNFYAKDGVTKVVDTQGIATGAKAVAPAAPAVDGFTFLGWKIKDSANQNLYSSAQVSELLVTEPVDYIAIYEEDIVTVKVRFVDKNNVELKSEDITVGSKLTAANIPTAPTVAGLKFIGWNDNVTTHTNLVNFEVTAAVTFKATYEETNLGPVLTVPEFSSVNKTSTFNIMNGVSAIDQKDGDITNTIQTSVQNINTNIPGFQTVNYTVVDSDGNIATATQVVLVNDGDYVIDEVNKLIIYAKNFTKNVSDVNTSDAAIKGAAEVKVYNYTGNDVTSSKTITVDKGGYTNVKGEYNVKFTVTNGPEKTVKATVIGGNAPVLNVTPKLLEINKGATNYNLMAGVSVTDVEDDANGKAIAITANPSTIDTSIDGFTTITYTATDSDNNTTTAQRVVLVNDGDYVIGRDNIIHAKSFEKRVGQVGNKTANVDILENAQVKVFDKLGVEKDLRDVDLLITNSDNYRAEEGTYRFRFEVNFDTFASKAVVGEVIKGEVPNIEMQPFAEVNEGDADFTPLTGVTITDVEDDAEGTPLTITTTSQPEFNKDVPGFYTIEYTVTDSDGNSVTESRVVLVKDDSIIVDPDSNLIIQAHDFEKYVREVNTADAAIKEAARVKVYDKTGTDITTSKNVAVNKGTYQAKAGVYDITYTVAGGPSITKKATVKAGEKPVLTVNTFTEIKVDENFGIMNNVTVTDDFDTDLLTKITTVSTPEINTAVAGFYTIEYSVTDSDQNTVTATQVLLVNDDTYVVDPTSNLIIQANNFIKRVSEVNTADAAIKEAAVVKVFDKTGTDVTSANNVVVDKGQYKAVVNLDGYAIKFSVEGGPEKTINAKVVGGDAPIIKAPAFTEVELNSTFDVKAGVSAEDAEDDNAALTNRIVANPATIDTGVAGFYTVEYTVEDTDGNPASATQIVLVNDGTYVVDEDKNLVIQANNFTKFVSQVVVEDDAIKTAADVKLFDLTGTDVINDNEITVNKGTYTNVQGVYDITFTVTEGPAITVKATVTAGDKPVIKVEAFTEVVLDSEFDVKTGVVAEDTEDDNAELTAKVVANPTTVDTSVVGFTTIEYTVTDNDGNTSTATRVVLVKDETIIIDPEKGLIIQAHNFEKYVSEVNTEDAAIKEAARVKVYDKTGADITATNTVTVNKGEYQAKAGTYDITYTVENGPSITKQALVKAGEKPVLTVNAFTEIKVGENFDIMADVTVTDKEDDNAELLAKVTSVATPEINTAVAGFYTIEYSVTDNDKNTVTATQVLLVNDDTYVVDPTNDLVIQAKDFTKLVSEVNTADAAIKEASQVKVFDKTGNDVTNANEVTVNKGDYTNVAGVYDIEFTVTEGPAITVKATVSAGEKPVIKLDAFTEIDFNSTFDVKAGVSAEDAEDDNAELTAKIIATPATIDTSVAGFYTIEYSVTDNDNNTVTATRVVLVNDDTFVIDPESNLIIQAKDFTKLVSEVNTADAAVKEAAQVKVYDKAGNDVTADNNVTVNKGNYTNAEGVYDITFTVTDGPAITIKATVSAGEKPVIKVEAFTEIELNSEFNIKAGVSAEDAEDDNAELTAKVVANPTTVDTSVVGFTSVEYTVTDNDGNVATATRIVLVKDETIIVDPEKGLIIQAHDFEKYVSDVDTSDAAIKEAARVKVYDKTGADITATNTVTVNKGTYQAKAGVYDITYTVENGPSITKKATVTAGEKPVITVEPFTEITLNSTFEIMNGLTVTDAEDDDAVLLTRVIAQATPEINTAVAGFYTIEYSVTDSDQNTVTATRVLLVNDGTFVVDPESDLVIRANDFIKRVSEVNTDATAIKAAAAVKVFDKTGTDVTSANNVVVDKVQYKAVVNLDGYAIKFSVEGGPEKTINAKVVGGDAPIIKAPAFTEVELNSTFDVKAGVSAEDAEDDNVALTNRIVANPTTIDTSVAGFYTVEYTVEDTDGNPATATQIVLVNDGTYVVDEDKNLVIQANNFTKFVSQVVVEDDAIKTAADVKLFDLTGTDVINDNEITVNKGTYTNAQGVYDITFTVTEGPAITVKATVTAGDKPVIKVEAFTEVVLNSEFDVKTGVTVEDTEDDNAELTAKVVANPTTVDTSVVGFTTIEYTVTDNDGNTSTATRVVLVKDETIIIDPEKGLIIQAHSFEKYVSDVDTSDAAIKEAARVKVYDKTGADITATNTVTVDKGEYQAKVGTYDITYTVENGPSITKQAIVTAGEKPVLTVNAFTEIKVGENFDVMADVTVTDKEDDNAELLAKVTSVATPEINTAVAGFYTIEYSVTDNDNNTVTATQVLLVNDDTYVVDPTNDLVIQAKDFTKLVSEVNTADAAIKEASQVKVFDKTGNDVTNANEVTVNKGDYTNVAGVYDIAFTVTEGPAITVKATVSAGEKPVIKVEAFTEIDFNSTFDVKAGVSAEDAEDDNAELTAKIIATPATIDTSVAGFYTIEYSVTDNDNNTVTATRVVLVNDDTFVVDPESNLIINAVNFTRTVSKVDTADAAVKEAAQVKVYDKAGNDVTADNTVTVNNGGYTNEVAVYDVVFSVVEGPEITIKANVTKGEKPSISVPTFTEINVGDSFDKMTGVTVTDKEDDNAELTAKLVVTETPEINTNEEGLYVITYSVTDLDGNTATATQVLLVNDGGFVVDPTSNLVIQAYDFTKLVSEVSIVDADILDAANVKVYDKVTGLELTDATITIDKGTYGPVVGAHKITYTANTNAKNNSVSITRLGNVVTGGLPELKVPGFSEITINSTFDVMTGVSAIDKEDGDITNLITTKHTLDTSVAGFHTIEYSIIDKDGNETKAIQVVLVNDGSYIVGDKYAIIASDFTKHISEVVVDHSVVKADAQVKVYDLKTGQLVDVPVEVSSLGGYRNIKGEYKISFKVTNDEKAVATVKATVHGEATTTDEIEASNDNTNNSNDDKNNKSSDDKVALPKTGDESIAYGMELFVLSIMVLVGRFSLRNKF